jgi:hypothetical protein
MVFLSEDLEHAEATLEAIDRIKENEQCADEMLLLPGIGWGQIDRLRYKPKLIAEIVEELPTVKRSSGLIAVNYGYQDTTRSYGINLGSGFIHAKNVYVSETDLPTSQLEYGLNDVHAGRFVSTCGSFLIDICHVLCKDCFRFMPTVSDTFKNATRLCFYAAYADKKRGHRALQRLNNLKTKPKKTGIMLSDLTTLFFTPESLHATSFELGTNSGTKCRKAIANIILNDAYYGKGNTNKAERFRQLAAKWWADVPAAEKLFEKYLSKQEINWLTSRLSQLNKTKRDSFVMSVVRPRD